MSDITHSDYCPEDHGGELEDCPTCMARLETQQTYYRALYALEDHLRSDEIRDAYSDPTERAKRDRLLDEAVCNDIDSVLTHGAV